MFGRRVVEEFKGGQCEDDRKHDGRIYLIQVKVNGEEEVFNCEVFISGTTMSTEVEGLDQILRENGWKGIAKRKITKAVQNGCLDGLPPRSKVRLTVEPSNLDALVSPDVL